jgi:hypothetical protein
MKAFKFNGLTIKLSEGHPKRSSEAKTLSFSVFDGKTFVASISGIIYGESYSIFDFTIAKSLSRLQRTRISDILRHFMEKEMRKRKIKLVTIRTNPVMGRFLIKRFFSIERRGRNFFDLSKNIFSSKNPKPLPWKKRKIRK